MTKPVRLPLSAAALLSFAAAWLAPVPAEAASIIKSPGRHPNYSFEAEPHALFGPFNVGPGRDGFGLGFRGTIPIVDNGFVKTINNSVGIGFGIDWMFYDDDRCFRNRNDRVCFDDDDFDFIFLPVVMQWNFWLSESWSVYGEPGLVFRINDDRYYNDDLDIDPAFYAGGRFLVSDSVALMMRIGHPSFSFGVSFLL